MFTPKKLELNKIALPFEPSKNINLFMLRLDKTDARISGNKWFKLKYNLEQAKKEHYTTLLSFGGAYSNHIHALAFAAQQNNFKSIGIIRGEKPEQLSKTLRDAHQFGMQLHYISRKEYKLRHEASFINELIFKLNISHEQTYIVPEGGSNHLAVKGCQEIWQYLDFCPDYLACPCGSGGTLAGLISAKNCPNTQIIGFSALKGADYLNNTIKSLISHEYANHPWQINQDYHFGGFAKHPLELIEFMRNFYAINNIPLDYVYTAKMMYGIFDLLKQNYFKENSKIVAIHTGGLQGNQSVNFSS